MSPGDVSALLRSMHDAVVRLVEPPVPNADQEPAQGYTPAVSVRKSLASKDWIISMIDGKPYKTLRLHLATNGLTPEDYRARYNLRSDYPMVAESYSEARRTMAKSTGLGRKAGQKVERTAEAVTTAAKRGGKAALQAAKQALGTDQ